MKLCKRFVSGSIVALLLFASTAANANSFEHNRTTCLGQISGLVAERFTSISSCTWILGFPGVGWDLRISVLERRSELYELAGLHESAEADQKKLYRMTGEALPSSSEDIRAMHVENCIVMPFDSPIDPDTRIKSCSWLTKQPECSELPWVCGMYFRIRAGIYSDIGELELALADINHEIDVTPDEWEDSVGISYAIRGMFYAKAERYDEALADYDRAVGLAPEFADVYAGRAEIHFAMSNWGAAIADLRHSIQQGNANPSIYAFLAWVLATREEPHRNPADAIAFAVQAIDEAERIERKRGPYLHTTLAAAYASAERFEEAMEQQYIALKMATHQPLHVHTRGHMQLIELYQREIALVCPGMPECGED